MTAPRRITNPADLELIEADAAHLYAVYRAREGEGVPWSELQAADKAILLGVAANPYLWTNRTMRFYP